jgi:hypothetical protein
MRLNRDELIKLLQDKKQLREQIFQLQNDNEIKDKVILNLYNSFVNMKEEKLVMNENDIYDEINSLRLEISNLKKDSERKGNIILGLYDIILETKNKTLVEKANQVMKENQ